MASNADNNTDLQIRSIATLKGNIVALPKVRIADFMPPSGKMPEGWKRWDVGVVQIAVDLKSTMMFAASGFQATKGMCQFLKKHRIPVHGHDSLPITVPDGFQWPDSFRDERHRMTEANTSMMLRINTSLKYSYDQYDLDETVHIIGHEFAFMHEYGVYFALPPLESFTPREHTSITVDQTLADNVTQRILNEDEPLLAMTHLHRAVNEKSPRHKWIDATIAAELAVKEFLIRQRPELGPLLDRLPSPPPSTLYGPILKEYVGEPSPVVKAIKKGEERRNKLVHSATNIRVTEQEAADYVKDIEFAILHLRSLLYPNDQWLKDKFQKETEARKK